MKDKIDFGEFGVLTWNEAFDNMELSVDDLLSFAETDEEFETIYIAGCLDGAVLDAIEFQV